MLLSSHNENIYKLVSQKVPVAHRVPVEVIQEK